MNQPKTPSPDASALDRRAFLGRAGLLGTAAAMAPAFASAIFGASSAEAAISLPRSGRSRDLAILNFALNLEYLEAEFYTLAERGQTIDQVGVGIDGSGTPGPTTYKNNPRVPFQTPAIRQYAAEIAQDERNHVSFLRTALVAAGPGPVAKPAIDLLNSFNTAAQAAGIGPSFDPFADDLSFLLGAYIFEDVGVTAYNGAAPLLSNKGYLSAAAGILAVEAYHASEIRTLIFGRGGAAGIDITNKISLLRDALGGGFEQGITNDDGTANIVPTDSNSIAFARDPNLVLNIVYGARDASSGLFFPNGINL